MKIDIGKKIKDIAVTTTDNKSKISDYLNKNLILYFYPRDMTPGCTTESIEFNENISKIKRAGWNVVGVSRDTIKSHLKFIDKHSFKFPLITTIWQFLRDDKDSLRGPEGNVIPFPTSCSSLKQTMFKFFLIDVSCKPSSKIKQSNFSATAFSIELILDILLNNLIFFDSINLNSSS